jgi:hypothetical protein
MNRSLFSLAVLDVSVVAKVAKCFVSVHVPSRIGLISNASVADAEDGSKTTGAS